MHAEAATTSSDVSAIADDQRVVWLPADAMTRYWRAKVVGGLLFATLFAGWLVIQWSNMVMRLLALSLLVGTVWMTWESIASERRRFVGRKVSVSSEDLRIEQPEAVQEVKLARIDHMRWIAEGNSERAAGLWWFDSASTALLHMDDQLLANEREARSFIGWLRQQTSLQAPVRWNDAR